MLKRGEEREEIEQTSDREQHGHETLLAAFLRWELGMISSEC